MINIQSKFSLKNCFSLSPIALCIAIATTAMSSDNAIAQEDESKSEEKSKSVEVITVTATRQTENLQDVAISVTALSAGELQNCRRVTKASNK
jgi:ABC-type enterochelin transport system substrate-binding protein